MDNFSGDFFGLIGKPMLWNTEVYGTVAVHVKGISPNGRVAVLTIDGGESSRQAQTFPELSDGIGYAILGDLAKRPRRTATVPASTDGFDEMTMPQLRAHARTHYSTIGKLTKRADLISAMRSMASKQKAEVTF